MPQDTPGSAAIKVAVEKFGEVLSAWLNADWEETQLKKRLSEIEGRKAEIMKQYHDCYSMARLFSFDLDLEYKAHLEKQRRLGGLSGRSSEPVLPPIEAKPKTIKERVLEAARAAAPNAVRAGGIRKELDAQGIKVHPKTIGMTLYRLLREGRLARDGWDWFLVPEAPPQEQESPGIQPGLVFERNGGGQ